MPSYFCIERQSKGYQFSPQLSIGQPFSEVKSLSTKITSTTIIFTPTNHKHQKKKTFHILISYVGLTLKYNSQKKNSNVTEDLIIKKNTYQQISINSPIVHITKKKF